MKRKPMQVTVETLVKKAGHTHVYNEALRTGDSFHLRAKSDGYMDLVIETVGQNRVAVAHYFVQNGDMMRDPEIVFDTTMHWLPVEITQDPVGIFRHAKPGYYLTGVTELARMWAMNIRHQGFYDGQFESLTHGNDDPDPTPETNPTPSELITATNFQIVWTEYSSDYDQMDYPTWEAIQKTLDHIYSERMKEGPAGWYYKTKYVITWSDGDTYDGRIDIGDSGPHNLAEHIRQHLEFHAGLWKPDHLSDEDYQNLLVMNEKHDIRTQEYIDYLATHDIPETVTASPSDPDPDQDQVTDYTVEHERDWTWIKFPSKPDQTIIDKLKSDLAARWSRKRAAWYIRQHVDQVQIAAAI